MRLVTTHHSATTQAPSRRPSRSYVEPVPATESQRVGRYANEPETCRRSLRQFLPVMVQLALLYALAKTYRLEGRGFELVLATALASLPIHYLLPFRWKKPFFVLVSIAALGLVFGGATLAVVLPIASALIALCQSRVRWSIKAGGVGLGALILATARAGLIELGLPTPALPVLGTMFMFRMIIYLYELKHTKTPESTLDAASYFCMLPNFCFLHFPVVDYRTMQRGYFASDVHQTQRVGLRMMLNGIVHLLLYRLVDHQFRLSPGDVTDPGSLGQFLAANYLLYLHVSGQFHIACGMLHLFGYKLPETHHRFLLATGFTDYWRRINIYWKDFMVRIFFNPVAFRLKRQPQWLSLSVATAVVFLATWALHAYQAFWLSGTWAFSIPDALFWGILGILVMINVQRDAQRRPRHRLSAANRSSFNRLIIRTIKIVGTLTTIMLLWSLWTSPNLSEWLAMLGRGLGFRGS